MENCDGVNEQTEVSYPSAKSHVGIRTSLTHLYLCFVHEGVMIMMRMQTIGLEGWTNNTREAR